MHRKVSVVTCQVRRGAMQRGVVRGIVVHCAVWWEVGDVMPREVTKVKKDDGHGLEIEHSKRVPQNPHR